MALNTSKPVDPAFEGIDIETIGLFVWRVMVCRNPFYIAIESNLTISCNFGSLKL